mgnify:CR=1 FL=1
METTQYFDNDVLPARPEIKACLSFVENALTEYHSIEKQTDGRTRRWVSVPEREKYIRVIVEPDGETIHNALFDSNYTRRQRR